MRIAKHNYDVSKIETPNRTEYIRMYQQLAEIEDKIEDGELVNTKSILYEFAERLKKKATTKYDWNDYVDVDDIDEILQEFLGE